MSAALNPVEPIRHNRIYTAREVAAQVFRASERWFCEHRAKLMAEEGFPRPISKFGHPRWYGADLLAFQRRQKELPEAPVRNGVHDFTAVLAARAAQIGRKTSS